MIERCVHDGDRCRIGGVLECGGVVDGRCPFHGDPASQAVYCSDFSQDPSSCGRTASWDDVKRKGEAIYRAGGVRDMDVTPVEVDATVYSDVVASQFPVDDGGPYEVTLSKRSWENHGNVGGWVQGFLCECQWGQYNSCQPGSRWQGRFCFPPHEKVLMWDGSYKDICDVQEGDVVQTIDGAHRVTETSCRRYRGDLVRLSFSGSCFDVTMTKDHPVISNHRMEGLLKYGGLSKPGRARKSMECIGDWTDTKTASSIRDGDIVLFSSVTETLETRNMKLSSMFDDVVSEDGNAYQVSKVGHDSHGGRWRTLRKTNDEIPFSNDLAYLLGWYTAEGSIEGHDGKPQVIRWTLSNDERAVAERLCAILKSFGCENPVVANYEYRGAIAVKVSSGPLAELMVYMCGRGSKSKALSREIMLAGADFQREFIEAYCAGDGTSKGSGMGISTSSECLARQISMIAQRVYGVDATICKTDNMPGPDKRAVCDGKQGTIYHVSFGMDYVKRGYGIDAHHTAHKVTGVSTLPYEGDVYNLTVEGNHTYVVSGLTVHNCSHAYATLLASNQQARQDFFRDHEGARGNRRLSVRKSDACADDLFHDVVSARLLGDAEAESRLSSRRRADVDGMLRQVRVRRASGDGSVAFWNGLSAWVPSGVEGEGNGRQ